MKIKHKRKKKNIIIIFIFLVIIILLGGSYYMLNNKDIDSNIDNTNDIDNENIEDNSDNEELKNDTDQEVNNSLESAPLNNQEFTKLEDGEYLTNNGYTLVIKDGLAYIDNHLIVNKTYSLTNTYKPLNPYQEITTERCNNCLEKEVMESFNLMASDASSIGLNIYIASGYRSYNYQDTLYNNYSAVSGQAGADTYSARPGHSEHQTGLCFDLNSVESSFANTDEGIWINNNAHLYGFIIRYPNGKEDITGYMYEPWHLRYVGVDLATELYNNGSWITLEEYYGISSSY